MQILIFLLLPVMTMTSTVMVSTQTGAIIGSTVNYNGNSVKRFLGIPFAEPPLGELRFKKTVPVQPWSEPLVGDSLPPSCLQHYPFDYPWVDKMSGSKEDCLYMNIWVPENASNKDPKAVMFWIYSGGFSTGSNRQPVYDGRVLSAEGDVIVVTVNYRLGILGFLSTESEEAPGNMGLFDVLEALKWVNHNIQSFGGDKNRITVFGNSAGAIISGYLTISPLSTGLFQRIIMQSGSPAFMRINATEQNLELGQKVAETVGCASEFITLKENPNIVVACLRKIPADALSKAERAFHPTAIKTFSSVDGDEFLPVVLRKAISSGNFQDVDILAGNVKDEGSFLLVATAPELFGPYGELDPQINKTKGEEIILRVFKNYAFKHDVVNHYLSGLNEYDYEAVRSQVYHSYGDFTLVCPTIYFLEKFSQRVKNAYYYSFEYQNLKTVFAPWMGVTHFTEVPFVFGRPLDDNSIIYTKEEIELSKMIIKLWTSFAKYGVPPSGVEFESRVRHGCSFVSYVLGTPVAHTLGANLQRTIKTETPNQCSSLKTKKNCPTSSWNIYSNTVLRHFYSQIVDRDYGAIHLKNCQFFRLYYRF